ncbi:DUF1631 family protein [Massilia sp. erpn]|uniref:DUF1631 family protein n=1 Tax=Massilia sp. erpn TaxID=2738142 RepID=UPI002103489B|nr:DUF1631 family protein [Massilia sp. erpn]UTY59191.1 DUF1631 family protein [Massilia sp. erpn]
MNSNPTTSPAPKQTVSPRHALLESLIEIAQRHVASQFTGFATGLAGILVDGNDMSADLREVQMRLRAGNLLRNSHYALLNLVAKRLERAVRQELAQLAPGKKVAPRAADQPLSLVPYEEMDSKVALGSISKPFETRYADALATLNVRLAFLLDRDILRVNQNPFRPDVLLAAVLDAWSEFNTDEEAAQLLPTLLKPDSFIDLGPMLEDLNLALERKGVLPGSVEKYKARKADSHDASAAPARQRKQQAALAEQLRQFFSAQDAPPPAAQGPALMEQIGDFDLALPHLAGGGQPASVSVPIGVAAAGFALTGLAGGAAAGGMGAGLAVAGPGAGPAAASQVAGQFAAPAAGLAQAPWLQGAAQGFIGNVTNEAAQHASVVGAKQPLLSYLAQLQQNTALMGGWRPGAEQTAPAQASSAHAAAVQGAAMPFPAAAFAAGAPLPPNVFVLPSVKQAAPQGSLSRADESTIDLLSAVFETVFRDQSISPEIRNLIRFLQIPVLKAALLDKDFFFQEEHPARRMIDLLSRMGWEQHKNPDDPLYQAMQRSVDRVGRDYEHELGVFTEAVDELEASIKAEETAAAAAIAEPIAAALKQEKMAAAARSAQDAVALRIGTGEVIAVLEAFLENKWTSVLTIAYSVEDEKPGAVNNATQTMDDLIWSVKPKISADERKKLIARLPTLLSALNKWLDVIKWQDADRLQFFAELAECHASIVRAPLEISPERQLEISMEVAQKAAERRLQLQAKAEQEAAAAPPVDDDASIEVDSLTRGMWLEFEQEEGEARKVKLAWISPLRTLYIFSTSSRQEAFSLSGEALVQRFRDDKVRLVRSEGVVAQALSRAMGMGAVNDDATATATATAA